MMSSGAAQGHSPGYYCRVSTHSAIRDRYSDDFILSYGVVVIAKERSSALLSPSALDFQPRRLGGPPPGSRLEINVCACYRSRPSVVETQRQISVDTRDQRIGAAG